MPKWTIHLAFGCIATVALVCGYIFFGPVSWYMPSAVGLIVAVFAAILGSDIPDFDSRKTKIKHILGFFLGGFVAIMYLVHVHMDIRPLWDVFSDWEAFYAGHLLIAFFLFVVFVLLNTLIWFFPMRHHGRAHSLVACGIYGVFWGVIGFLALGLNIPDSLVVVVLGSTGYLSHLLLDLDIKVWKQ